MTKEHGVFCGVESAWHTLCTVSALTGKGNLELEALFHTNTQAYKSTYMHTLVHQGVSFTRWTCILSPGNLAAFTFSPNPPLLLTSVSSRGFNFLCLSTGCAFLCVHLSPHLSWHLHIFCSLPLPPDSPSCRLFAIYLPLNVVNCGLKK